MAWDVEGTKRKILDAATQEFAEKGPDGTTIERIALLAKVNKERVYNYFGGKSELFAQVLREQLAVAAQTVSLVSAEPSAVSEYAGRLFDYHRQNPALVRLLLWEALAYPEEVPEEHLRRDSYGVKTAVFEAGQNDGTLTGSIPPDVMNFLLLAVAGYWAALPQVARMITDTNANDVDETARRRTGVVEAARRLTATDSPNLIQETS
ncbi:TetR family transcriptional regulator [Arthrobacter sp. ES3-54]|uniref:TetR/AcrR family transcriptional regulator n=1 Tax=Arthrobacter sp. ES3-54 TaxID=1502991 RepID=UPI0024072CFE|nr:TetR family transcriptional regulator [Arthrobacter sp. ES3-54]MDF9751605.1 AcrR family transcriptional regulator [Arthrobacter sp. ES3-54]